MKRRHRALSLAKEAYSGILAGFFTATLLASATTASADALVTKTFNNYGNPGGLIDMPTAEMAPDSEIGVSVTAFDNYTRTTLSFQITPWLTGSFRYAGTDGLSPAFNIFYDRSFDLKFRLFNEGQWRPAVAIGLRDFVGTGVLSGEYVVATKSISERLRVTGGIGWGRLGSYASDFSTGSRPPFSFAGVGTGGNFNFDEWFQGDAAFFGGASFKVTDKLQLSLEYSSDNYDFAQNAGVITRPSPWNFAADYQINDNLSVRAFALHGEDFGATFTLAFNPKRERFPGGVENAPLPVAVRSKASAADLGWTNIPGRKDAIKDSLDASLDLAELDLEGVTVDGRSAHVVIRNGRYISEAQALGRTLRSMSRELPGSVENLHVTLITNGIPASTMTFSRSDLERLENAPASEALAVATFTDTLRFGGFPEALPDTYPRFEWTIGPYIANSLFDPDQPIRLDVGVRGSAKLHLGSGWIASGSVIQKLAGNIDNITRTSNSVLPRVRSDVALYSQTDEPVIERLTIAKFGRLAPDFYSRVTAGYLERQYAGISGEVLWKPVDSRLALGVEANYVESREFDGLFGLRSRDTTGRSIPAFSGHVSAYYDFGNGFHGQLDAGRYLAGDWGATLSIDREFANGWSIGAFATITDVSSEDFGEGSFDRGLRFTIPLNWVTGTATKQKTRTVLRPLTRDGGQRLFVSDRLYRVIRESHEPQIAKTWGKYWR